MVTPIPKADEVLIKVHASSVNKGDWHIVTGHPFPVRFIMGGLLKPKRNIPGGDVAGVIVKVGRDITKFKPGDKVYGDVTVNGFGAWAEFVCAKEKALAIKPESMSFVQAGVLPVAAVTALQGIRDHGRVIPGMKVLVNGASGGVGMFAVILAKAYGAEVTAVCHTKKVDMAHSIHADHVIDYTKVDFSKTGELYDLIVDCAAYKPFHHYIDCLSPKGTYVLVGGSMKALLRIGLLGSFYSRKGGKKFCNFLATPNGQDLEELNRLYEQGKLDPYIGQKFTLRNAADSLKTLEERRVNGKLSIVVCS